jgi:hypothetical protein
MKDTVIDREKYTREYDYISKRNVSKKQERVETTISTQIVEALTFTYHPTILLTQF